MSIKQEIDSLSILNQKIDLLNQKIDSVTKVNTDLMVNHNYFSDIIDTQMDWFAIVFVITFGILGLAYWFGIFKYFTNKFRSLDSLIKNTRNSLIIRITQKDKDNVSKINSNHSVLENKIESLEKVMTELNNQRFNTINEEIIKLQTNISSMVIKTENEIKTIIEKQKEDFEEEKNQLLKDLWDTSFNAFRSMFFSCYKDKSYSSALTWIIPMLEMIVKNKVRYTLDTFSKLALTCAQKVTLDSTLKDRFDSLNATLVELEEISKEVDEKDKIKQIRIQLNKTYYKNPD